MKTNDHPENDKTIPLSEYEKLRELYDTLNDKYEDTARLFREIIKATPMLFYVKDTGDDYRYVYSSDRTNQVWGLEEKDVIGKNDFDLQKRDIAEKHRKLDKLALEKGRLHYITDQVTTVQNKEIILDAYRLCVSRKNKPPYMVGMAWDITNHITHNDEFNDYLQRLVWACQAGKIYPWMWDIRENRVELTLTRGGIVSPVIIDLEEFESQIYPEDLHLYQNAVDLFVKEITEAFKVSFRTRYFAESGEYTWFELSGKVYDKDANGKPKRAIGVYRDITTDKEREAAQKAKEIAEESDKMKSAFVANMSHEIRTPLNAIIGFSNLLAEAETKEEKQYYLKIIESSNESLLQLISDILDISKIESGTMKFNFSDFNLDEIFSEQEAAFKLRAEEGVQVLFEKGEGEYAIHSEKVRLKQVLTNFLSNAVKYTTEGSIRFGYKRTDNGIHVYVTDTGSGIPADVAPTVFGRFVKLDSHKQGTGLGLAISKSIIDALNGEIGVDTELGKGTTFWFTIPCELKKIS